jgi:hypothetical protein
MLFPYYYLIRTQLQSLLNNEKFVKYIFRTVTNV